MLIRLIIIWTLGILAISMSHAQTIETEFGKNRVQYHDDFDSWKKYETENFITYWYGKARNIAVPAIQIAESNHDKIQDILEHRINDKIQMLVYTDISDFKQSNIGLEDIFTSKNDEVKVVEGKLFIYYSGDYQQLEKDIKKGIAAVYLNELLLGSNFRELVKNAIQHDLPEWFKLGISSYAGIGWDYLVDDELKDIFEKNKRYQDFYNLIQDHPRVGGHSFWYYIDQNYGKDKISNILYLTKITRDIEEAILYVLDLNLDQLAQEWSTYWINHYDIDEESYDEDDNNELSLSNKPEDPVSTLLMNPQKDILAYSINRQGRVSIKLRDLSTMDEVMVYRYGSKNNLQKTDFGYPVMAWREDGKELSFLVERRDKIYLRRYSLMDESTVEQLLPTKFNRIYSVDYIDDFTYLFTADTDGYTDLYLYETKNRTYERISNDFYDDRDAIYTDFGGSKGIIFASNRLNNNLLKVAYDTIIPIDDYNLFFYDLESNDQSLLRLTDSPDHNERYPRVVDSRRLIYLAEGKGVKNAYVYNLSENTSYPVTNKSKNIIRHEYLDGSYFFTYYDEGSYKIYQESLDVNTPAELTSTRHYINQNERNRTTILIPEDIPAKDTMKTGYLFQTEFDDPDDLEDISEQSSKEVFINDESVFDNDEADKIHKFINTDVVPARLEFRVADFQTKMDNAVLFEGLDSYTGQQESVFNPLGFLIKAEMLDLFEDYKLTAGMRFPLTLNGSEYFLVYEDRKHLIDKKYALYRKSNQQVLDETVYPVPRTKNTALLGMVQWKYPFDIFRSVRLTTSLRFDQYYQLSTESATFNSPVIDKKRFIAKLEYVFDNTIDYSINIKHGTRYKVYAQGINDFNVEIIDDPEFKLSEGITGIIGLDARHYVQVLKHSVLALRFAGASSFGNQRNLFYMGGVNNNFINAFNATTPVLTDQNFAYQTNIFHLRGFNNNIRNGTSYALVNTELRIPFFKYILNPYRGSSFLKNIQLVGFFDMGSAWYGFSPYSDKNPINTVTIESNGANGQPVVSVNARYYNDPLVMGFGAGLRVNLLGYMLRFDVARGLDTRVLQDRKFHLSLGMDF